MTRDEAIQKLKTMATCHVRELAPKDCLELAELLAQPGDDGRLLTWCRLFLFDVDFRVSDKGVPSYSPEGIRANRLKELSDVVGGA